MRCFKHIEITDWIALDMIALEERATAYYSETKSLVHLESVGGKTFIATSRFIVIKLEASSDSGQVNTSDA